MGTLNNSMYEVPYRGKLWYWENLASSLVLEAPFFTFQTFAVAFVGLDGGTDVQRAWYLFSIRE